MFKGIGLPELLVVLFVVLLLFGPARLPEMGRALGKSIREFRGAARELSRDVEGEAAPKDKTEKS